ncbi:MAG: Hsp33 family molecular chaperone HslO [Christensenellales bacterium]
MEILEWYCDNPHCHFEYNDFRLNAKQTIGTTGFISVIKDLKLKEPFIGSTPIISGEIAEDFAYYFQVSERNTLCSRPWCFS